MSEKNENQKNLLEKIKEFLLKLFNYLKNIAMIPFNKIKEHKLEQERKRKLEEERLKEKRLEEERRKEEERKKEEERIRAEEEEEERKLEARLVEIRKAAKEKGYDCLFQELNEKCRKIRETSMDDDSLSFIYHSKEEFKLAFYGDEDFWGGCFETVFDIDRKKSAKEALMMSINNIGFEPEKNLFIQIIINFIKKRQSEEQIILSSNFILIYNMICALVDGVDDFECNMSFRRLLNQNRQSILEISVEEWALSRRNFVLKMKDRFHDYLCNPKVRKLFADAGLLPSDFSDDEI